MQTSTSSKSFSTSTSTSSSSSSFSPAIKEEEEDPLHLEPEEITSSPSDSQLIKPKAQPYRRQLVWRNIIALAFIHIIGLYALTLLPSCKLATMYWGYFVLMFASLGVQTGAHRLWAHRSYSAHWSLRLVLSLLHVTALQNDLYEWCRDHRVHHKWSDTDADPHNANRGFFFSHVVKFGFLFGLILFF